MSDDQVISIFLKYLFRATWGLATGIILVFVCWSIFWSPSWITVPVGISVSIVWCFVSWGCTRPQFETVHAPSSDDEAAA